MSKIVMKFLLDFLEGLTSFTDGALMNMAERPFAIEEQMTNFGVAQFNNIFGMFTSIGITLIVVKFLKKGFDMYILWTDGDADTDPLQLVINFVRAMIVALTFTFLYVWFTDVILDIINEALKSIGLYENLDGFSSAATSLLVGPTNATLTTVIGYVIFFVIFIIIDIKLIGMGFEMLILRIGLPLACVGLMDADKGVFKTYMQKFFQVSITILVQVILAKLALSLMIADYPIFGLAAAYSAITTPKFIREFLIFTGGGGMANSIYSGARLVQMGRSILK